MNLREHDKQDGNGRDGKIKTIFGYSFEYILLGFGIGALTGLIIAPMKPIPCANYGQTGCGYAASTPLYVLSIAILLIFAVRYLQQKVGDSK